MTASTFDALAAARDLKAAGIEAEHAEAIAEGMRQAAGADHAELATKADIANLHTATKADIAALEARMYRAFWIQAAALIGTQLAIAGLIVHLLSRP